MFIIYYYYNYFFFLLLYIILHNYNIKIKYNYEIREQINKLIIIYYLLLLIIKVCITNNVNLITIILIFINYIS